MIYGRHKFLPRGSLFTLDSSSSLCSIYSIVIILLNLVNTIQTEPFKLGPSNLVHLLLMTRGQILLIFKVRGQRSRSP